jgi:lipopolysaccharide transport system ATP-binding protein
MADDIVIRAEGLGKKYLIGHRAERERYAALRDVLVSGAQRAWRKTADLVRGRSIVDGDTVEDLWALKNVNFEVKRGDVLGVIGRNGAGKTTLLKILSRITEPSEGRVTINGRVASLLEVGTGFHPELSGRENIYLNGAILGMTRAEIKHKFDKIVAFAEVEKFLDTPVKRYSSGMYVRLAFAVAAHLEPEILVVDEVLAVGDAEFQKKCLGKMDEVSRKEGRTVLFVSHNFGAIRSLCSRALLLQAGALGADGMVDAVVEKYLRSESSVFDMGGTTWRAANLPDDKTLKVRGLSVATMTNVPTDEVLADQPFQVAIEYEQRVPLRGLRISVQFVTAKGEIAFTTSDHSERTVETDAPGVRISTCRIPGRLLNLGRYSIRLAIDLPGIRAISDWIDAAAITVTGCHNGGTSFPDREWPGVLSPRLYWTLTSTNILGETAPRATAVDAP